MDTSIFRKAALERLSSPERLDALMQVTTRRGWISLSALACVVGGVLLWGFLGAAPDTLDVAGIMLRSGGHYDIVALGGGDVRAVRVRDGDRVRVGSVVAVVGQPQLELSIRKTEDQLTQLRANRASVVASLDQATRIDLQAVDEQRNQARVAAVDATARVRYLANRDSLEGQAKDAGLITPDIYETTVAALAQARSDSATAAITFRQLVGKRVTTRSEAAQQVFTLDSQIRDVEAQLRALREQMEQQSTVVSRYNGQVVHMLVDTGDVVNDGRSVAVIEADSAPLRIYAFTDAGRTVRAGMTARLSPVGVRQEEHGFMLARVLNVSRAPLGTEALTRLLRNDALVRSYSANGAAYLVTLDPERDPAAPDGFRWTSPRGTGVTIESGTTFTGSLLIEAHRPITMVVPAVKKWLEDKT